MNNVMKMGWPGLAALALAMGLNGCGGGGEDTVATASRIAASSPAMLTQASADNYDDNVNGMISGATLKRWKDDWVTERAKLGLTGKLIIFQVTAGPAGSEYIKPNGTTVFTYLSPSSEWIQTRNNGVIETQSMVPDGTTMDALLKKYNIDPARDMIVAAMGTGSTGNAMAQGRIWYALRYWGLDKKNLAILNGGNQWLDDAVLTAVETRTSSPLRITRNEQLQSLNVKGLFPAGEGAGYAGGILSAGVDGIRIAEAVALSITT